jgi:hypothetical protein
MGQANDECDHEATFSFMYLLLSFFLVVCSLIHVFCIESLAFIFHNKTPARKWIFLQQENGFSVANII